MRCFAFPLESRFPPVFNSCVKAFMEQGRGQHMDLQCHPNWTLFRNSSPSSLFPEQLGDSVEISLLDRACQLCSRKCSSQNSRTKRIVKASHLPSSFTGEETKMRKLKNRKLKSVVQGHINSE
ncbi:uncharacterized protein LOC144293846 isoform X3 [Canis aureus]